MEAFPTLAELTLSEPNLTDATAAALVDGLAAHSRGVTALSLSNANRWSTGQATPLLAQR